MFSWLPAGKREEKKQSIQGTKERKEESLQGRTVALLYMSVFCMHEVIDSVIVNCCDSPDDNVLPVRMVVSDLD